MTVRGLVLVLGGLPLAGSLLVQHHRERRCHGASWCVVEIALAFTGDEDATSSTFSQTLVGFTSSRNAAI